MKLLESLRLLRIKKAMSHAAKTNKMFHLWWHPHNFGINQAENLTFLEKILEHYQMLYKLYAYQSYTMTNFANLLKNKN